MILRTLRDRIAEALGWTLEETLGLSLASLRELVRPLDSKLVADIDEVIRTGAHITRPVCPLCQGRKTFGRTVDTGMGRGAYPEDCEACGGTGEAS